MPKKKHEDAPVELLPAVAGTADDPAMAKLLTAQYRLAIGGLWEVVKFGAMLAQVRDSLNSARGIQRGQIGYTGSLKEWLEANCPDVNVSTAYRFLTLAEGVRAEVKLGAKVDLCHLLTAPEAELDARLASKRQEIAELLDGKSQRQLLFAFMKADRKPTGGARDVHGRRRTEDELAEADAKQTWQELVSTLTCEGAVRKSYALLPQASRRKILDALLEVVSNVRESLARG
jgi:hypothetical protein